MAIIPKSNYTQIPNVFFDEIMKKISPSDNLVLMAIMRKTFGWQKQVDKISYSQIIEMTGLVKSTVSISIKSLEEKGLIYVTREGQINTYSVVVHEHNDEKELVRKSNMFENRTVNSPKIEQLNDKTSPKIEHTKETSLNKDKETITQQPLIPNLSSKLITKETSNNNDSPFQTKETNKAIETTRVSSKTKETNKKKEKANALPTANESFYKNIESIYFENYKSLFEKGKLQIEVPAYSYAKNRAILSRYKNYDESLLKKVLDNAMDDKWIVDNGYGFNQIFSENVFNRLVNIKSKDDLIPVQNNCAKCGFPLQNNKCLFCG